MTIKKTIEEIIKEWDKWEYNIATDDELNEIFKKIDEKACEEGIEEEYK